MTQRKLNSSNAVKFIKNHNTFYYAVLGLKQFAILIRSYFIMKRYFFSCVPFFFALIALGCHKDKAINLMVAPNAGDTTITSQQDTVAKTFLALGDSYTIGQSVQITERFPAQTAALLKVQGLNIKDPEYIATSGWTTLNLQNAIAVNNPKGPYDIVTLLIGVNDQYQTGGDTTGYRERFTNLLRKAIELAGGNKLHVFVLSIPDYSVTPFASGNNTALISMQIDTFNFINEQVTLEFGVDYTNITPSTRLALSDPSLIATDGLHPSAKEYAVWAALLSPKIKAVLK